MWVGREQSGKGKKGRNIKYASMSITATANVAIENFGPGQRNERWLLLFLVLFFIWLRVRMFSFGHYFLAVSPCCGAKMNHEKLKLWIKFVFITSCSFRLRCRLLLFLLFFNLFCLVFVRSFFFHRKIIPFAIV